MLVRINRIVSLLSGIIAIASAASITESRPPKAHELGPEYSFENYLSHFDKSYPDPEEYIRRSEIFANNLKIILNHNEGRLTESGEVIHGYVMGLNRFTDLEAHEVPMGYNKVLHPEWSSQLLSSGVLATERRLDSSTTSYSKPPSFTNDEVSDLPNSKDWSEEGVINPTIPRQGGCGSCWTFAAIGAIEAHLAIATGEPPMSLSEQSVLNCAPDPMHCGGEGQCTGSTTELAYNYFADVTSKKTSGVFALDDLKYSPDNVTCDDAMVGRSPAVGIDGWTQLPTNDYKSVMNALAKVGPLSIAIAVDENFVMYEKGVMDGGDGVGGTTINHAVVLVGYGTDEETGEDYYKIRNSWGEDYGEMGYIRVKRTADDSTLCGMDEDPLVGLACALDEHGNQVDVKPVQVCGTIGVLFDVSYPVRVHHWNALD